MPLSPHQRNALYVVLGLVGLAALFAALVDRRGTLVEAGLREWLVGEAADATDSVYQVTIANLRLRLFPGHISIDSIRLVTDTARNDFRSDPYPVITATAAGCRITGIGTWALLNARGVTARLFRCDDIRVQVIEASRAPSVQPAAANDPRGGIPFLRDSLTLPAILPRILLERTELARLSLDYTRRPRSGKAMHIHLERLAIRLSGTRIDPSVPPSARKPLFSEQALVAADTLQVLDSNLKSAMLGRVRLDLTDSTLAVDSVVIGPRQSDDEWVEAQKTRSDRIRFRLDSARFRGVDYRRLVGAEGAIVSRHGTLYGMDIDVLSEKRLPPGAPRRRRSPQQWLAAVDRPLAVDTVVVAGSRIAYHEHAVGRSAPGTMTWEQIEARVTGLKTPSSKEAPPLVIKASTLLLGAGKLETTIEVPLASAGFDMKYSGSLGPMDLTALNRFVSKIYAARIDGGALRSLHFAVVVRNGRSTGQVVPVYQDFKIQLEDRKANFLKKAGMSIVSLFANTFKVRGNNPGKPDEKPVVGVINYPYEPTASLPKVFWFALREGIGKVFLK